MNRFKSLVNKLPIPSMAKNNQQVKTQILTPTQSQKKLNKLTKSGPQLMVTKLLMIHGPLQNKQLWRIYTRMIKQNQKKQNPQKINCFNSLTHMKRIIHFMNQKNKLSSAGYNKKAKQHLGWKVQQKKALKDVHPEIIEQIKNSINTKDLL